MLVISTKDKQTKYKITVDLRFRNKGKKLPNCGANFTLLSPKFQPENLVKLLHLGNEVW
jgi:hypothetical protein